MIKLKKITIIYFFKGNGFLILKFSGIIGIVDTVFDLFFIEVVQKVFENLKSQLSVGCILQGCQVNFYVMDE